ncbi:MAG: sensor histidine kinase [Chloroflexota bacterium]|nr:sensor histidine kinase [Chloroflexota bacterium]
MGQASAGGGSMRGRSAVAAPPRWTAKRASVWLTTAGFTLLAAGLTTLSLSAVFVQRRIPTVKVQAGLTELGISATLYAAYLTAVLACFAIGCFTIAGVIARRRPDDAMARFASLLLIAMGAANAPTIDAMVARYPALAVPGQVAAGLLWTGLILFFLLFPDGRFTPAWMRVCAIVWLVAGASVFLLASDTLTGPTTIAGALIVLIGLVAGALVQIYRYLRRSNPVERQQTKWVVSGIAGAVLCQLLFILPASFFPSLTRPGTGALLNDLMEITGVTLGYLLIPITLGIAILRHRLWEIDILLNRALVYGVLTACVIGFYVLLVGGLGTLLHERSQPILALVATGLIAVLFQPWRNRLQLAANRFLYGERDDPYTVISRLGQRWGQTAAPHDTLVSIVTTVAEALKLPYAAIALPDRDGFTVTADIGTIPVAPIRLPLPYGQEIAGELQLGPRAPGEALTAADRRLLADLAPLAGAAIHAARLSGDLQQSRERLVATREEERRRLRRDLHDGLGPALAAQTLKVGSARALLIRDPAAADHLLAALEQDMQTVLADVRRLVYHLRPPALDDLGLVGALRDTASQLTHAARSADRPPLHIRLLAPDPLPSLPAAVEVAAYRIVQEALTNVVRHAHAETCQVTLRLSSDTLEIEIADDGIGLPRARPSGVGLASMRERATELGGTLRTESPVGGGTRILTRLPLPANRRSPDTAP